MKSFPNFHKHSFQILSNLTIYPLIQTTLSSTHNPLKFLQIYFLKSTSPTKQSLKVRSAMLEMLESNLFILFIYYFFKEKMLKVY